MGKKEKIIFNFSLYGFLLSKSTWMCNNITHLFFFSPLLTQGLRILLQADGVKAGWDVNTFLSPIITLLLCGPIPDKKQVLYVPFPPFPLCFSTTFSVHWLEVTARKQELQELPVYCFLQLCLCCSSIGTLTGTALGREKTALRTPPFCLQAAKIFLIFSCFMEQWFLSTSVMQVVTQK